MDLQGAAVAVQAATTAANSVAGANMLTGMPHASAQMLMAAGLTNPLAAAYQNQAQWIAF